MNIGAIKYYVISKGRGGKRRIFSDKGGKGHDDSQVSIKYRNLRNAKCHIILCNQKGEGFSFSLFFLTSGGGVCIKYK